MVCRLRSANYVSEAMFRGPRIHAESGSDVIRDSIALVVLHPGVMMSSIGRIYDAVIRRLLL